MFLKADYRTIKYQVEDHSGETILAVLRDKVMLSSRLVRKLKGQHIRVNGHLISLNARARQGDIIEIIMPENAHGIYPEDIAISVLYEDQDIVAINKQSQIVAHPTAGHPRGTLSNALRHYALNKGEDYKPRLINRLDRDTTGVILFAKNPHAQHIVSEQIKSDHVDKYYNALVHGKFQQSEGVIDAPIGLADGSTIMRCVRPDGKASLTKYWLLAQYDNTAMLRVKIETGRTHQIRVHMQSINHIIVGDTLYGSFERVAIKRQALHACEMIFMTPRNGKVTIQAPLPSDIQAAVQILA